MECTLNIWQFRNIIISCCWYAHQGLSFLHCDERYSLYAHEVGIILSIAKYQHLCAKRQRISLRIVLELICSYIFLELWEKKIYSADEDKISCQTGSIWDPINFFRNILKANGKVTQGYEYLNLILSLFDGNSMFFIKLDFSQGVVKLKLNISVSVKMLKPDQTRCPNEHWSGSNFCPRQVPQSTWK